MLALSFQLLFIIKDVAVAINFITQTQHLENNLFLLKKSTTYLQIDCSGWPCATGSQPYLSSEASVKEGASWFSGKSAKQNEFKGTSSND